MKLVKTGLLVMAFMCLLVSCSKEDTATTQEANYSIDLSLAQETDWEMANEILTLVNEHRVSIGLQPIQSDKQYASAHAVKHTQHMIDVDGINHDNFLYRKNALQNEGAESVAENVAFGYDNAETVVNAWLNSQGHRATIEGPFTHSGFGIVESADGKVFYTQLFYRE
jgi:uncharacterized protein YkwD